MSEGLFEYIAIYEGVEYRLMATGYRAVHKQMSELLGVSQHQLRKMKAHRVKEPHAKRPPKAKPFVQLCFSCARSAAPPHIQCCWDRNLKPVPGWTAEVVYRPYTEAGGKDNSGYKVIACPLYLEEKKA